VNDPLSIFSAARDAGDALGLRVGDRLYTFAQLADMTRRRLGELSPELRDGLPYTLEGTNALETLITLYALLEIRVPALLVHPKLMPPERTALSMAAARAGPVSHPDAAAIIFTSGTTGEPRGAVLTRSALVASAQASAANLGWLPDDVWLLCMPIARVGGLSIVTRCLAARRCAVLAPGFDPGLFPEWIATWRITLVSLVPTMLSRVFDAHPAWRAPPHLRSVLLGGAMASSGLLRRAQDRRLPIILTYGLTETSSQVVATPYAARFAPAACGAGIALRGIDVRVEKGRIEVRGPTLMAGYWNDAPLAPGAWVDTGDLGELDGGGCLHVRSRRADLIVTGGENAYPAEVERTLEAFPGIAAAGVFGVPDEVWGHTVAAALVAEASPPPDTALFEYVSRQLAPHKRPRHVCYLPRLPHASSGKLDRRALAENAPLLRPLVASGAAGDHVRSGRR
jgi:O-succinylbenzoic acid--CoA ligase